MGTNYYWTAKECEAPCEHCAGAEELHIGKSSGGWVFALHIYPSRGIFDLSDWAKLWTTGIIKDEYGRVTTSTAMKIVIEDRSWDRGELHVQTKQFLSDNYAVLGPKGLLRADSNRRSGVHPGKGTWDCHEGDFS